MPDPEYDIREAVRILAKARSAAAAADLRAARFEAAQGLLEAVIRAAESVGCSVVRRDGNPGVLVALDDGDGVAVKATRDGIQLARVDDNGRIGAGLDSPALEYDPAAKMWIGTEPDAAIAPVPGELLPRRSAVAVVADRIAAALAPDGGIES